MKLKRPSIIITFVLPTLSYVPNGGFKIIYEYANRLQQMGHRINLVHPNIVEYASDFKEEINALTWIKFIFRKLRSSQFTGNWFPIDNKINNYFVPKIAEKYVPDSDIIVATGWQTAKPVVKLSASKGSKFYFIQSLEKWAGPEDEILETWKYPMNKVVISKWLFEFANSIKEKADYIPNGLDYTKFNMDIKPERKNSKSILMLVSNSKVKGTEYGLQALVNLKSKYPEIEISLFGTDYFKNPLPDGANFYLNPSQTVLRKLFNSASIFLSPSLMEGFPLPPAESMMCGSALVATDIGGHKEYAVHGKNSLLFPPKDINKASEALITLIEDNSLRIKLAYQGYNDIQKYSWDDSVNKLSNIFTKSFNYLNK